MARPETDFQEENPRSQDPEDMAISINRISLYPIYRAYRLSRTVTSDYTIDPLLDRTIFADASSNTITVTLPPAADADYAAYTVVATDVTGGSVTVATGDGNINGSATVVLSSQFDTLTAESDDTNYFRTDL